MAGLHHGNNRRTLLKVEESEFFHGDSASSSLYVQASSGSLHEGADTVTDVQTIQEGLEGVCTMGRSPLEFNGTSVGKGVNANAVSTESGSNGLGFGLHAEDIGENVSANCFGTDLEEVFAVGFKSFNFD